MNVLKKWWFWLIVILVIFLIIFTSWSPISFTSNKWPPTSQRNCEGYPDIRDISSSFRFVKSDCYTYLAEKSKDDSICDKITDINKKELCKLEVFKIIDPIGYCETLGDLSKKEGCYYDLSGVQGVSSDVKIDACNKIECKRSSQCSGFIYTDSCLSRAALINLDKSICEDISPEEVAKNVKRLCIEEVEEWISSGRTPTTVTNIF